MRASGGLVCQGIIDGTNGTDGYNTVVVPLYRRSASVLTDNNRPSGTLTYTFSTGRVTGASTYFNGWSQTIPTASANTKLYVIMAVARSQSDTDEIAATDWSTPVEYVADGMSSAPVFIYKRAAIQPTDKPADGAVYTFATGALTGTLNGWSTNIPATDNNHYPCWVRQAMAVSRGTTDTINADEWSNPATKLVEDGASITKKSETYRYATNNTGVCPAANSADWSTTKPTLLQKGYWLFTETTITWSDDSTTVLYTADRNPNDGVTGQDIIVDGATVMKYYVGDSNTTHPAEDSSDWKDLSQVTQTKGKWLWSKATTYYRKASSAADAHDAGYAVTYNVTYIALDGTTPEAARGIESVTEYYKATNSSTPMSKPSSDDGWSTDPNLSDLTNKWGESYKYLWNFEKVTYNKAPLVERTIPQIVAIWTKDGVIGASGRGIDSVQNYYKVTNSATTPSKPSTPGTDGWGTTPIAPGQGQYLWNYEVITWINPSGTTETDVQMIGYAGTNGTSITKASADTYRYAIGTSGITPPTSGWSATKPSTFDKNSWLWTETTIHWSDMSNTVLYSADRNPNDGLPGQDIIVDGATVMKYYVGTDNTTHPANDSSEWKDLSQVTQEQGKWLWSQATTYYRKASSAADAHDAGYAVTYNVTYIALDGTTPEAARGIESVTEYYKATNSSTPMSKPSSDDGWSTDPNLSDLTNKWGESYKYLWNFEKVTYNKAPLVERTIPQIVAIWTKDGVIGASGRGIDSVQNYYKVTNSATTPSKPSTPGTDGWGTTPIAPGQGQYLWNYEVITWINPSGTTETDVQMIGYAGTNGTSITKASADTYRYAIGTSGITPPTSGWSATKPSTFDKNSWLWTETTIHWSDMSNTVLYSADRNPNDGLPGQDIIVDGATVMKYYVGTDNTTHPANDSSEWKDLSQVTQEQGKWLWSQATTYYRKANSASGSHDAGSSINYNVNYISKDGKTGRGIQSITEYYQATNSNTARQKPSNESGWDTDPNLSNLTDKWGQSHKYLWNMEKTVYINVDGTTTTEYSIPQILAIWTKDGDAGHGIDSITNYYKVTNNSTVPSKPTTPGTGGWSTTPTAPNNGEYLWNYEVITWVNPSSTTETSVQMIGYAGANGDDAVTYKIVFTEAWAKVDASNTITARLRGYAYKIIGSTRTAMASATIRIGYILNDSSTYAEITTNSSGYFSEENWFNGDDYGPSGYSQGSQVIFAAIIVGTGIMCAEYVTMTFAGAKGDTGRMYYIAGEFPKKAPYTRTAKLCPVVYYGGEWWYLDVASATGSDTPSDSSSKWKKLENYGVVLTDAIFVKNFAQFGAAIITGDWLISVHGMIGNTYYGGNVESPDEYNDRAAYTYFDPAYPWGYDPFQLPVKNEEVETEQNTSWTRITDNFKLPAGTYTFNITCHVNSSDYMHLRLYNGDDTSDDLYLGGTGSDEAVTLTYTRTLTSSQNWNLRATMNASGENGYVVAVEVVPTDARFIPNYAVDLRTGKTYQSDAHIKGAIQCIGPTSKITIEDGVIRMFGAMSFPNIVLGVNEDGCAVLNFYDKNGNFKYGLGPDKIFENKSQAESMTLQYYNVDTVSDDCTSLVDSDYVMLYLYMFKNQLTNNLVTNGLYKYLAKIVAGVYGPGQYCANSSDAQNYDGKIIKYGYSSSVKLRDQDLYSNFEQNAVRYHHRTFKHVNWYVCRRT